MMPRKLHPLTQVLLEQRYQQNFLQEKIDDGGDGAFSFNRLAKAKGKKIDEIGLDAANFAAKNLPFVERMAKAEVPESKTDPEAYGKKRSELAKEMVLARKKAFDDRQKAIAGGIPDPIQVDDTEILKRALANKPELAQVLTRDEYENLAGDITNPLELQSSVKDETGKEYSKAPISIQQWPGIDPNAAIVYDALRGAQESLTTPEGLAKGAAFGAGFKALGMGAGALGKVVAPKIAKFVPKFLPSITKYFPGAIGKARDAAEMGSAVGQSAVNLAGLGAMGYGAYQAGQEGKLGRFAGELAGGVGPFGVGRDVTGVAIPAGIKAAPAAYAKGKEIAGDVRAVAKGTAESLGAAGSKVAGAARSVARGIADTPWSEIPSNVGTAAKDLVFSAKDMYPFGYKIIKGKAGTVPTNRSWDLPTGERSWETGLGYDIIADAEGNIVGERPTIPTDPSSLAGQSSTVSPSKPGSSAKQRAAATFAAVMAARAGGVPSPAVDVVKPSEAMVSTETGPRETMGNVEMRNPTAPPESGASTSRTTTAPAAESGAKVTNTGSSSRIPVTTSSSDKTTSTSSYSTKASNKFKNDWWKKLENKNQKTDNQSDASKQKNSDINQENQSNNNRVNNTDNNRGGGIPPVVPMRTTPPKEPPPTPPTVPPTLPTLKFGGGESRGSDLDDARRRQMAGTDINAILRNLFSSSQTISIE
jgi:hypothetical protein